jgi:transcriptional regulator GlxA family with amidase domain
MSSATDRSSPDRALVSSTARSPRYVGDQFRGSACTGPSQPVPVRYRDPARGRHAVDRRRLARVLDYVEADLEADLTVDRLASMACLSQFHFARAFEAAIGQSPHRYVSGRRLERAKALLATVDRTLVDIALALNFSCQANFNRAFRQATGQTPGEYRRNLSV